MVQASIFITGISTRLGPDILDVIIILAFINSIYILSIIAIDPWPGPSTATATSIPTRLPIPLRVSGKHLADSVLFPAILVNLDDRSYYLWSCDASKSSRKLSLARTVDTTTSKVSTQIRSVRKVIFSAGVKVVKIVKLCSRAKLS